MAYVIAEPCVGQKNKECVEVCPIDCIHGDEDSRQLYIDPDQCLFCGACAVVCPVGAVFEEKDLPVQWKQYAEINAAYFRRRECRST